MHRFTDRLYLRYVHVTCESMLNNHDHAEKSYGIPSAWLVLVGTHAAARRPHVPNNPTGERRYHPTRSTDRDTLSRPVLAEARGTASTTFDLRRHRPTRRPRVHTLWEFSLAQPLAHADHGVNEGLLQHTTIEFQQGPGRILGGEHPARLGQDAR